VYNVGIEKEKLMTLKEWLKENEMNDRQFAKQVGVHTSTVNLWRNGNRMPTPHWMQKIMKVTGEDVTYMDFLSGYRKGGNSV
jgi:transcriptional regulator with XRE-family HTH domain